MKTYPMHDDYSLLRRYAERHEQAAFAELVDRYVNFVYNVALRRANGDAAAAADGTQSVFVSLARTAGRLSPDTVLAAWLHTTTRNAVLKQTIADGRRRRREQEAVARQATDAVTADWDAVRPLLDDAVDELLESERVPLVLRFFRRLSFAEIGAALAISEDAARMRVERALERLRTVLGKRGITSTAAALAGTMSAGPAFPAPAGLAGTIAGEVAATTTSTGLTATLASLVNLKVLGTAAVAAIVAFAAGTRFAMRRSATSPSAEPTLQQTVDSLRRDNERLQRDLAALTAENARRQAAVRDPNRSESAAISGTGAAPRRNPTLGMPRYEIQRNILNNLRQVAAARDQYVLEHGQPPASVDELVGGPTRYIRRLQTVAGEDYAQLTMAGQGPLTVTTPDGTTVTYDPAGTATTKPDVPPEVLRYEELKRKIDPTIGPAVEAYRAAHNGNPPRDAQSLVPYFTTPQEGADFLELDDASKHLP